MALRNAFRRAASAAPWATAAPRSLKRPEAMCRAVCSASSARRLAPITPSAACWKGGRSFAAAAECACPPFRPASDDPRDERRTRATPRTARRVPASRAAGPKRPRAIVKIFFPEARRFAFPKWTHRVFLTRQSPRDADPTSPFPHVAKTNAHEHPAPHATLCRRRPAVPGDHHARAVPDDDAGQHRGVEG